MVSVSYFALIVSSGFVFLGVLCKWRGWREGIGGRIIGVNRIGGIIGANLVLYLILE